MLKPEQVPIEVANAIAAARKKGKSSREIAAAALNAWPGMWEIESDPAIILPLPTENTDGY